MKFIVFNNFQIYNNIYLENKQCNLIEEDK